MSVSDSDDSGSLNSILHVNASQLYPKKPVSDGHDSEGIPSPFNPLCGESVEYINRITEGVLALSNYRLYYQRTGTDGKADFNIPLGLIDVVEIKDIFHIYIQCKDARTYRCTFSTNEACSDWHRRLTKALAPPKTIDELFAFVYYAWASEEGGEEISSCLGRDSNATDYFTSEYERMRFDTETSSWRLSNINANYKLCASYPEQLIVPTSVSDGSLENCAGFRCGKRIPAVVWRHRDNGAVLARSSQPEVGWFCWRNQDDEHLLKLIAEACPGKNQMKTKLLVMDARSYTTAVANRARGGGCECLEYYSNIDIQFMNLANIHYIRKSFSSLRLLCASPPDNASWYTMVDGTKWLQHMSLLIMAAVRAATALEKDAQPVLVHCSDGWDRTSQIVSLAELLLDPYYRTIEGFQVLCEREWLDFGHKFADRIGIGEELNEKCPVFLQWLDCVHNLTLQFPCVFEFNKRYLIKLAEHTCSNLFGTFLCNTSSERKKKCVAERTFSVWKYLSALHFRNHLYDKNSVTVLWPKYNVRDLHVWRDLYIDLAYDNQYPGASSQLVDNENQPLDSAEKNEVLTESENGSLNNLGNNLDSMLESAINCQPDAFIDNCNDNVENEPISRTDMNKESLVKTILEDCNGYNGHDNGKEQLTNCYNSINTNGRDNSDSEDESSVQNSLNGDSGNVSDEIGLDAPNLRLLQITQDIEDTEEAPKNCNGDVHSVNQKNCDIIDSCEGNTGSGVGCGIYLDEEGERFGDAVSVDTSVETIVNNSRDSVLTESNSPLIKTVTNGLKNYECSSCTNGRQQLTSLLLDPIDGLPLIPDDVQDRMQQLSIEHKTQLATLSSELYTTRNALVNKLCTQCVHQNMNPPEKKSEMVSDDDKGSVCSTEISWEAVDERDFGQSQVLWVPDYAVNCCTSCNNRFWLGRRKHHCRNCGKIFCADCSRNVTTLPNEQLYDPVRVCEVCYQAKRVSAPCLSYSNSAKQTTCKQAAAGEEPHQNSNLTLPPTPPI